MVDPIQLPSYMRSSCAFPCVADRCAEAVKFSAQTKRWFITMGHRNFNSRANNRTGYATERAARKVAL